MFNFGFKTKTAKPRDGLDALRARHPWPDISGLDGDPPYVWTLDGGGRELVAKLIKKTRPQIFLEVGTFLGGSALRWLATRPNFTLIILDSWPDSAGLWRDTVVASPLFWGKDTKPLKPIAQAIHRHGIVKVALHNLRRYRDRVIPIQMPLEAGYAHVRGFVEPDMIYVDADKQPQSIMLADQFFPAATLCGDDWEWQDEGGGYPVRDPVRRIAALRGSRVLTKESTWVVDQV